jgi:hypothetical protein
VTETRCIKIRLKPGSRERVHEWASEIHRRKEEALETLRDEGVLVESVFLERATDGDFLVYDMKATNTDKSFRVAQKSNRPIDLYHRKFKEETWGASIDLELLLDLENLEGNPS